MHGSVRSEFAALYFDEGAEPDLTQPRSNPHPHPRPHPHPHPHPNPKQGAEAWRASVLALPGLEVLPAPASDPSLQAAGPLRIAARVPLQLQRLAPPAGPDPPGPKPTPHPSPLTPHPERNPCQVRLPLDAAGVAAATAACADAAARWVGWVRAAEEHEARKTMATLAYDTKARAACAAATAGALSARYGDAGAELAALDAGPVDAANRGGAMNQAASSAFGDSSEADMSARDMQLLAGEGKAADASQLGGS